MRKRNTTYILFPFLSINIILFFGFLFKTEAQQVTLIDHYYINPSIYNPAAVGYNNLLEAYILRNNKFKDFDGGQTFNTLTLGAGLKGGKYGIGINLSNNSIDIFNSTQVDFSYSYRIKINDNQFLRLGLSAGISDFRLNFNKQNTDLNDELLQASHYNNTEIVANIGAYYTNKNLTIALAIPQLINQSNISKYDDDDLNQQSRHFLLSGSYELPVHNIKDLSFVPNFMIRYIKNTPLQYDINALLKLKNKGWFSVNYKNKYAIGLNIGVTASEKLKVGYSYNINTQNSAHISPTNHEFLIGYTFRKTSNKGQNHKSQDLTLLKDMLEDKYDRISELEKELKRYAADKKLKKQDKDRDDVLTKDDNSTQSQSISKLEQNNTDISSDDITLVDNNNIYNEEPLSPANNELKNQDKDRDDVFTKDDNSTQSQAISKLEQNNTDINSDDITLVDTNIIGNEESVSISNNGLKNQDKDRDDVHTKDDNTPESQVISKLEQNNTDISSDDKTLVDNNIIYTEVPVSPSNNGYTIHEVGRIELDKKIENLFFAFGKSDLSEISKQKISKIALIMQEHNSYILKLHGYTDDTRSTELNNTLLEKRLDAVYNYLIKDFTLEGRIITIPHEEDTALPGNNKKKSRAFNRRVYLEMYSYD